MGDVRVAYEPDDEVEALAIESLLTDEGIACRVRRGADTAYPGIADQPGAWGAILVDEADLDRTQALIADFLAAEPESVEPELGPYRDTHDEEARGGSRSTQLERGVKKALPWLLVLSALAGSLALNVKFLLRDRNTMFPTGEIDTRDAYGVVLYTQDFREGSEFPREMVSYSVDGRRLWRHVDARSDGWIDYAESFHDGDLRIVYRDDDEDGVFERGEVLRGDSTLARWTDADGDQIYEEVRTDRAVFTDRDGDSIYDEVRCRAEAGARTFDVSTCAFR